ncbi:MAG: choice-of-anchor B family protein [Bdellovibrionales bacterium]|nr:choice-of-anchor B family protein [Bdellovibrionales bacterium]
MNNASRACVFVLAAVLFVLSGPIALTGDMSESYQAVCKDGKAADYPCKAVDLAASLDLGKSGHPANAGNDIWGWTDPETGKEYALMGLSSKTAFVDVSDPAHPKHIGDLPTATDNSIWRDIKVYKNHAFIVSEAFDHGMQVFDLTRLRGHEGEPTTFEADARYTKFGSVHNVVINEDTGYAYAVGSNTCDAGMHVVDIRDPKKPTFSTCVDRSIFEPVPSADPHGEDYTHDAQCVVYKGPDTRYQGRELCFCSNADTVNIVDVTDKAKPTQIAVSKYNGLGYTHQGWLTEDQRYFFLGDELDEVQFGHKTKTLVWDFSDLHAPKHVGSFHSTENAIDHNMYVKGNLMFQANYDAGLRILKLGDLSKAELSEVGFFDTEPTSNVAEFDGAWSVYPFFKSGTVVVSNIDATLYVLRPHSGLDK